MKVRDFTGYHMLLTSMIVMWIVVLSIGPILAIPGPEEINARRMLEEQRSEILLNLSVEDKERLDECLISLVDIGIKPGTARKSCQKLIVGFTFK